MNDGVRVRGMEALLAMVLFVLGGVVTYLYFLTVQLKELMRTVRGLKILSPDQLANAINDAVESKLTGGPH